MAATSPFQPVVPQRTFEAIVLQLKDAIASGALRPGDRLPPERELAERFQASRASVREALRVLETLGIVGMRRGADNGTVLLQEPGNVFTTVLDLLVALRHVPIGDLVEFRVMMETGAARRLAESPADGALAALSGVLAEMAEPGLPQAEFHRLDATFHVTLVRSVGNTLLNLVETAADSTLRTLITDVALVAADWTSARARIEAEHRGIYQALAAGQADEAATLVTGHIRYWGNSIAALLRQP
jgi:GntR family transcriptional repressor for pyruvate dehydrogenase complex